VGVTYYDFLKKIWLNRVDSQYYIPPGSSDNVQIVGLELNNAIVEGILLYTKVLFVSL
jgi:hypothetical protein